MTRASLGRIFGAQHAFFFRQGLVFAARIPNLHEELRKVKGSDFEVVTPPAGYRQPE